MHKLFVLSHLRTLARLGITEFSPQAWEEAVARNSLAASGDGLLYRLPREELKHSLNIVCPINNLEQPYAEEIILASKALRSNLKTDEAKHCARCPFVQQCSHAKKPHSPPPPEQVSSLRDLVLYSHGLQQLLKPDSIFYRQWVAAYRLGDSLIASIDDLSKGGQEIKEYDRLRVEGIQAFEEKMAYKKGQPRRQEGEGEERVKEYRKQAVEESGERRKTKREERVDGEEQAEVEEFEDLFKRVDAVAEEKGKMKPKTKAPPKEKQAPKEGEESFGRDFSFDQEAEFEPTQKKFTKNSAEKDASIDDKKGYQRIERDQGRPDKGGKAPYNKFNPERQPIEGFEEDFARFKPKGDNRKPYENRGDRGDRGDRPKYDREDRKERYDRNDRFERTDRGDSRGDKYDRPQRSNERGQWGNKRAQWGGNDRGGERDFRDNRGKQERYGGDKERYGGDKERYGGDKERYGGDKGRFDDRRGDQGFRPNNRQRDSNDDFPRIKELNRNSQRDNRDQRDSRDQRPRDSQESYVPRPASAPKSNPYVAKWQPEEDVLEPRQARRAADSEPASRPKIIDVEGINESGDEGATRSSRRGRGRPTR